MKCPRLLTPLLFMGACLSALHAAPAEPPLDHMVTIQVTGAFADGEKINLVATGDGSRLQTSTNTGKTSSYLEYDLITLEDGKYCFHLRLELSPNTEPKGDWTGPNCHYEGHVKCTPGEPFLLSKTPIGTIYLNVFPVDTPTKKDQTENNRVSPGSMATLQLTGSTSDGEVIDVAMACDGTTTSVYGRTEKVAYQLTCEYIKIENGRYRGELSVRLNTDFVPDKNYQGPVSTYSGWIACLPGQTFPLIENELVAVNLSVSPTLPASLSEKTANALAD